jgi:hypothetical protein
MGPQQNVPEKQVVNSIENGAEFFNSKAEIGSSGLEKLNYTVETSTTNLDAISQQVNDALLTTVPPATSVPSTLPPVINYSSSQATSVSYAAPNTAEDTDLIEKEWVDRAKKIISDTKNEPYLRDQEVTKLREDYKQKRYPSNKTSSGA